MIVLVVVGVIVVVAVVGAIGFMWKKYVPTTQTHKATAVIVHSSPPPYSTATSSYPNNGFITGQTNSGYIAGNDYSTTTDTAFGGTSFR